MTSLFYGTQDMFAVVVAVCCIVLVAMLIDLGAGLHKARQRHEVRTSWGLKRTLSKFIAYEGGLLIAAGVDVLIHFSHLYDLIGWHAISGLPIITCLVGIFLLIVEFLSVQESAGDKTKKEYDRVADAVAKALGKDELLQAVREVLKEKIKGEKQDDNLH